MSTLRVGVLMGGRGSEKEVSFNSGRTICDHLDAFRYTIIPIFQDSHGTLYLLPWRFLHRGKISDFEHRLAQEAEKITWDSLKERVDFIYIAMHGRFAEDGTLQGFLELLKIPYLGSKVMASALSMDKNMQKQMLKAAGITVPKSLLIQSWQFETYLKQPELLLQKLSLAQITAPYILKPNNEGSSIGISVAFSDDELISALKKNFSTQTFASLVIDEYIKGMEFTCITITDYKTGKLIPLPPTEIVPEPGSHFFNYEQKYMPGRSLKFTPARCSADAIKKIQDTCIAAMKILGIENLSRIDGFLTSSGEIIIIDPNSLAGMSPSSFVFRQAAEINLSHTRFINHLIETELAHYNMTPLEQITASKENEAMDNQQSKKKIGILLGGASHEKEISLESGRNVFYKLSPVKYEPIALFVSNDLELYKIDYSMLVRNSTKEIALALKPEMKIAWNDLPSLIDFAFIALHGGEGENGSVQGALEMLNIPYNGSSVLASSICMDKYKTGQFLKSQGFEVPEQYLLEKDEWLSHKETILQKFNENAFLKGKALIVKPHDDGCSVMVSKAKNEADITAAINAIIADGKQFVLIEECLNGMELTIGVVGNSKAQALPPSQTVTSSDILSIEEKFLPGAGENQTPAPLPKIALALAQKAVEDAYTALNCKGYARIDCFYQTAEQSPTGHERVVILEFNTLPGLTPATCIFHQAAEIGLKPMEFIDLIVELGFEEHNRRGIAVSTSFSHSPTSITMSSPVLEKF